MLYGKHVQSAFKTESMLASVGKRAVHHIFGSEGHMFDFISPAAARLGRDRNLLVPPQILTFPICCVTLQQIKPTQPREC